jgi:malonyl-CoA O-methyltransferase
MTRHILFPGDLDTKRANVLSLTDTQHLSVLTLDHSLNIADVHRHFDRAARGFDNTDFVHSVTRDGLFARLQPVVIDAQVVVDLGCATGSATQRLAKRFRGAKIIAVDLSRQMLERCRGKQGWFSKVSAIQADASALPFADQGIDIVFANLMLPWADDLTRLAEEVSRVLRKDGLFVFATFGPDSLLELRDAWAAVDDSKHVNRFLDMHDVGDALVRAGLRDPVLDVDRLTVTYDNATALFRDLTASGARNALTNRNRSLVGKGRLAAVCQHLEGAGPGNKISLNLELVYGHCWGGGPPRRASGDVHIDPAAISVRSSS